MRWTGTLSRYLIREVALYSLVGLLGVGSILVLQNLLRRLGDLGGIGISFGDMASVAGNLSAMLASYAVPVAFLFGVLAAIGRISADSEWTAMRALGISFAQIVRPIMILGCLVAVGTAHLLHNVEPKARRDMRTLAATVAANGSMIKAGQFIRLDNEGKRLLFVEDRGPELGLKGVVISDHTNQARPFTIFAESGSFAFDQETAAVTLTLAEGDIHFENQDAGTSKYRRIAFGNASYIFDLGDVLGSNVDRLRPPELETSTLRQILNNFRVEGVAPSWARVRQIEPYEIQLHRRYAVPFASVLFAFLGVALGVRRTRGARSWGALLCVVIVFLYYTALSFGIYLAENGFLPAMAALWLPNLLTAGLALATSLRARRIEL